MTVMGDASMDGLSDAGSIPARSTRGKMNRCTGKAGAAVFLILLCRVKNDRPEENRTVISQKRLYK